MALKRQGSSEVKLSFKDRFLLCQFHHNFVCFFFFFFLVCFFKISCKQLVTKTFLSSTAKFEVNSIRLVNLKGT